MIINLTKSKLFTESPERRFAREYDLPEQLWTEIWRRYALLEYTIRELCEYYEIKTKRKTTPQSMQRWIWRTEVYCRAKHIMLQGVEVVDSEFFGDFEQDVIKELCKNLNKSSVKGEVKALI